MALRAVGRAAQAGELAQSVWAEIRTTGRVASDVALYLCRPRRRPLEDGRGALMREAAVRRFRTAPPARRSAASSRGRAACCGSAKATRERRSRSSRALSSSCAAVTTRMRSPAHSWTTASACRAWEGMLPPRLRCARQRRSTRTSAPGPESPAPRRALAAAALGGGVAGSTHKRAVAVILAAHMSGAADGRNFAHGGNMSQTLHAGRRGARRRSSAGRARHAGCRHGGGSCRLCPDRRGAGLHRRDRCTTRPSPAAVSGP